MSQNHKQELQERINAVGKDWRRLQKDVAVAIAKRVGLPDIGMGANRSTPTIAGSLISLGSVRGHAGHFTLVEVEVQRLPDTSEFSDDCVTFVLRPSREEGSDNDVRLPVGCLGIDHLELIAHAYNLIPR